MIEPWYSSEMNTVYSHPPENGRPGVELVNHLMEVAERAKHVVPAKTTTPTGEPLRAVVETLAYVHDLGKATTYFQKYLLENQSPEFEQYRHHAPIGSFAAYHALDAQGFDTETCLAGFLAVAKHHGYLPDIADYIYSRAHRREGVSKSERNSAEQQQTAVAIQIKDIDEYVPDIATEIFDTATAGHSDWASFRDGFGSLLSEIKDAVATTGSTPGIDRNALSKSCYEFPIRVYKSPYVVRL